MSRPPRTEPSLPEWAALGLLCEAPTHGWAIARGSAPKGEIGRVYSSHAPARVSRARAVARSGPRGGQRHEHERRRARSHDARRHETRPVGIPDAGAAAGRARPRPPLRADAQAPLPRPRGLDPTAFLNAQERALAQHRAGARAASSRRRTVRPHARPLATLGRPGGPLLRGGAARSALGRALVYRPIGYVVSSHIELDGMPLQPIAERRESRRIEISEAASRMPRRPRRASLTSGCSPTSTRAIGWEASVPTFLDDRTHGTFATRSPHRPNPIGLSLARILEVRRPRPSSSTGSTSSTERPSSISSRTSPCSTARPVRSAPAGSRDGPSVSSSARRTTASPVAAVEPESE